MKYKATDGVILLDRPTPVEIAGVVRQGIKCLRPELVTIYAWDDWVKTTAAGKEPAQSFSEYAKQFD